MRSIFKSAVQAAILVGLLAAPAAAAAGEIRITVTGIKNSNGYIVACLWLNGWQFPNCESDGAQAVRGKVPAVAGSVTLAFGNVSPGKYAVTVGHDQNSDGMIERHKFFKYPIEGGGASNYPEVPRFAPFHHVAQFPTTGEVTDVTVVMHYP